MLESGIDPATVRFEVGSDPYTKKYYALLSGAVAPGGSDDPYAKK